MAASSIFPNNYLKTSTYSTDDALSTSPEDREILSRSSQEWDSATATPPPTSEDGLFSSDFRASKRAQSLLNQLDLPTQRLIYAERWLNGGSRTYSKLSSYTEMQNKYQPQGEVETFSVPVVSLPTKMLTVHLANPNPELMAHYSSGKETSFAVHPQFYKSVEVPFMQDVVGATLKETNIETTPTASSRTVVVLDDKIPSHCVKLHCPAKISRFVRKLDALDISKALRTSEEFDRAAREEPRFPKIFGYLPESIGVSIGDKKAGWGYLVREMTPRPTRPEAKTDTLVPMFSLYSSDLQGENGLQKPLLTELITKSKLDPTDFVLNKILFPVIESWCFLARDLGMMTQAHGQNLLLEIGADHVPTRVIFRDLSTYMDRNMRELRGLSNVGFPLPHESDDYEQSLPDVAGIEKGYYSLCYDSFVGHHLFDYIAKTMEEEYHVPKDLLQAACKAKFAKEFPTANAYFPENAWYYSAKCVDGSNQEVEDTGKKPDWR